MSRLPVTVSIICLNEEETIANAIQSVAWADEVIVVDSGSTDRTQEIARQLKAKVIENAWPGYGQQKNFAQSQASHDWVLNLDADEIVPPELAKEIQEALVQVSEGKLSADGFSFPRKTFYIGRWIRHGGWYPNILTRLVNRKKAVWTQPNVHEQLQVTGPILQLNSPLQHYAFTSIHDQIITNLRFSRLGAKDLKEKGQKFSLFKLIVKPLGKFIETYFLKKGFLDGLPGFIISINAAHSMFLKYAFLSETQLKDENPDYRQ